MTTPSICNISVQDTSFFSFFEKQTEKQKTLSSSTWNGRCSLFLQNLKTSPAIVSSLYKTTTSLVNVLYAMATFSGEDRRDQAVFYKKSLGKTFFLSSLASRHLYLLFHPFSQRTPPELLADISHASLRSCTFYAENLREMYGDDVANHLLLHVHTTLMQEGNFSSSTSNFSLNETLEETEKEKLLEKLLQRAKTCYTLEKLFISCFLYKMNPLKELFFQTSLFQEKLLQTTLEYHLFPERKNQTLFLDDFFLSIKQTNLSHEEAHERLLYFFHLKKLIEQILKEHIVSNNSEFIDLLKHSAPEAQQTLCQHLQWAELFAKEHSACSWFPKRNAALETCRELALQVSPPELERLRRSIFNPPETKPILTEERLVSWKKTFDELTWQLLQNESFCDPGFDFLEKEYTHQHFLQCVPALLKNLSC